MRDHATAVEGGAALEEMIGLAVRLPGHFVEPVRLEGVRQMNDAVELRVRTASGTLDETILTEDQLDSIEPVEEGQRLVDSGEFFDFIEAHRIQLAYAHDPNFGGRWPPTAQCRSGW
jgi:hypothetical protein